jgi:hypothetical protein
MVTHGGGMTDERIKKHRAGTGNAVTDKMPNGKKCVTEGCGKAVHAKGLCTAHYRRLLRHGDASVTKKPGRPVDVVAHELCSVIGRPLRSVRRLRKAEHIIRHFFGEDRWFRFVIEHASESGVLNLSGMQFDAEVILCLRRMRAEKADAG